MKNKTAIKEALEALDQKTESKAQKLLTLIPEGHSPAVYLDLIKSQVLGVDRQGNNRSDEDLMLFLYTCKRTGLDPLAKQIYAIYRWDSRLGKEKMTIQAGIDGFRLIAQRNGDYAGQDEAIFTPEDESSQYPVKAIVTIYKMVKGERVPFTATARWAEYVNFDKNGEPEFMWKKMPYLMLAKCAESLALRKAFPNELSGIYTDSEMQQSANPSILGDLPVPERFKKETEVVVDHGAPDDESRPEIKKAEPVEAESPSDESSDVTKQNKSKVDTNGTNKISEMRERIEQMKKEAKENEN